MICLKFLTYVKREIRYGCVFISLMFLCAVCVCVLGGGMVRGAETEMVISKWETFSDDNV